MNSCIEYRLRRESWQRGIIPAAFTALGLRVNRRSIVSVRDVETIKLRKSIVKRCNRYDNGSYGA